MIKVTFISSNGQKVTECNAREGDSLLTIAHDNEIDLEGACEGNMACSTCHIIIDPAYFDKIPQPTEEEEEMLDLTSDLHATSRLGCQIIITRDLDGLVVTLPKTTSNMMGL